MGRALVWFEMQAATKLIKNVKEKKNSSWNFQFPIENI